MPDRFQLAALKCELLRELGQRGCHCEYKFRQENIPGVLKALSPYLCLFQGSSGCPSQLVFFQGPPGQTNQLKTPTAGGTQTQTAGEEPGGLSPVFSHFGVSSTFQKYIPHHHGKLVFDETECTISNVDTEQMGL